MEETVKEGGDREEGAWGKEGSQVVEGMGDRAGE